MSFLDFLMVAAAMASVVYVNTSLASVKNTRILVAFLVVVLGLQLTLEGLRGYLTFLYITYALLLALFATMGFSGFFGKYKLTKRFIIGVTVLCILPAVTQTLLFPVASLPFEKGQYTVGTKSFLVTSRQGEGGRTVSIRLFYPADKPSLKKAPWFENGKVLAERAASYYHFPRFFAANLDLVQSNAYYDTPLSVAAGEIPVVLISHKLGSHSDFYVSMAETLATRGYMVALINHSRASLAAVDEKGTFSRLDRSLLDNSQEETVYNLYNEDLNSAVRFIGKLDSGQYVGMFKDRLRMENMMLIGHGRGGRAQSQPSKSILNIGCQVILDPFIESETVRPYEIYKIPTLLLSSEEGYVKEAQSPLLKYLKASEAEIYYAYLKGGKATDFNGLSESNPVLRILGLKGNLMVRGKIHLWQTLIGDYADARLKNKQRHGSQINLPVGPGEVTVVYRSPRQ